MLLALLVCALAAPRAAQAAEGVPYAFPWPYHEWDAPSGAYTGKKPLGYVMIVHGGAWSRVGPSQVRAARYKADEYRARGWATLNTTYRAGANSSADVTAMYDLLRHRVGPAAPICGFGGSAGGHLVLLTATLRKFDCVVSEGGGVDLSGLYWQKANGSYLGPRWAHRMAVGAFGRDNLWKMSPLRTASLVQGRVLMATASSDPVVPHAQQEFMQRARPATQTMIVQSTLDASQYLFVHSYITAAANARYQGAVSDLLAGARYDVALRESFRVALSRRSRGRRFASTLKISGKITGPVATKVELHVDGRKIKTLTPVKQTFRFACRPSRRVGHGTHRVSVIAYAGAEKTSATTTVRRVSSQRLRQAS